MKDKGLLARLCVILAMTFIPSGSSFSAHLPAPIESTSSAERSSMPGSVPTQFLAGRSILNDPPNPTGYISDPVTLTGREGFISFKENQSDSSEGIEAWQCYQDGGPACYTNLNSVAMVSAREGWAVGSGGILMHYLDGVWQKVIGPSPQRTLDSVSMLDSSEGWAVGHDFIQHRDLFLHWDGSTWSEEDVLSTYDPSSVDMLSASDGWAVGGPDYDQDQDKWVGTTVHWDGSAWQAIDNPSEGALFEVDMISSKDGWAVGESVTGENNPIILHWDGVAWSLVPGPTTNSLASVSMLSTSDGWAVGWYGTILHWNGSSWQLVDSPTANHLSAVQMVSANDGWAMGEGGTILHWDGSTWQSVLSPTWRAPLSISMLSASDGWAVGVIGTILHWNGNQWSGVSTPPFYWLSTVSMLSQTDGWAGGWDRDQDRSLFLHWNGKAWQPVTSPVEDSHIQFISMISTSDGWAVGWNDQFSVGDIFHWDGFSWQIFPNPVPGKILTSISMLASDDGWIVGDEGAALHWNGTNWEDLSAGIPMDIWLNSVSMVSRDDGWALGWKPENFSYSSAMFHWNGSSWQAYDLDSFDGFTSLDMISTNDGWAVGSIGELLHWDGFTWEIVSDPVTRRLTSLFMLSKTDGWAVGDATRNGSTRSSIAHWDGQAWLASPSPTEVGLSSVSMLSPDEGWAVGMGAILYYQRKSPELYLPLIFQDHMRCGQDSLTNGNFEQDDAAWELYTSGTGPKAHDLIGSVAEGFSPYAGEYAARLGGYEGVWDTLEQAVVIPAQGTLSYWWKMGTYETLPHHDWFSVELLQSDGAQVAQLAHHDDQDLEGVWQQDRIDVSEFAGQELVLRFAGYNDNYFYSWFDLDQVSLCGP